MWNRLLQHSFTNFSKIVSKYTNWLLSVRFKINHGKEWERRKIYPIFDWLTITIFKMYFFLNFVTKVWNCYRSVSRPWPKQSRLHQISYIRATGDDIYWIGQTQWSPNMIYWIDSNFSSSAWSLLASTDNLLQADQLGKQDSMFFGFTGLLDRLWLRKTY